MAVAENKLARRAHADGAEIVKRALQPCALLIVLLCVAGCTTLSEPVVPGSDSSILQAAKDAGFARGIVETELGNLHYWQRGIESAMHINVYVEGDGHAWQTRSRPSDDPTPRNPVAFKLALKDPTAAVLYIARPCQYAGSDNSGVCDPRYWTSHRYADAVVHAFDEALSKLGTGKVADRQVSFGLIGFSGGGAIAALVAARRDDIAWLVSVAANLDTAAWTAHHRVGALHSSLNPADLAPRLRRLPQAHLVGADDQVTPEALLATFFSRLNGTRVAVKSFTDFDHGCCWTSVWPLAPCALLRDVGVADAALCSIR